MASWHVNVCNYETVDHIMRQLIILWGSIWHVQLQIAPNLCEGVLTHLATNASNQSLLAFSVVATFLDLTTVCVLCSSDVTDTFPN